VQAQNVENQFIKPDLNNPLCLNEHYGSVVSLEAMSRGGKRGAKRTCEIIHAEKDELGRSVHALKMVKSLHEERDENGLSLYAVEKLGFPRKAVVVTFPDGSKQQFKSLHEAARFLCVAEGAVRKRIRKGPPSKRSKLAGYKFELV
jgi:hypothetical protein